MAKLRLGYMAPEHIMGMYEQGRRSQNWAKEGLAVTSSREFQKENRSGVFHQAASALSNLSEDAAAEYRNHASKKSPAETLNSRRSIFETALMAHRFVQN